MRAQDQSILLLFNVVLRHQMQARTRVEQIDRSGPGGQRASVTLSADSALTRRIESKDLDEGHPGNDKADHNLESITEIGAPRHHPVGNSKHHIIATGDHLLNSVVSFSGYFNRRCVIQVVSTAGG
jgi:hypothetical protein